MYSVKTQQAKLGNGFMLAPDHHPGITNKVRNPYFFTKAQLHLINYLSGFLI
jgi:hypothetical protein